MEPVEPRMEMRFIQRRRRQPQGRRGYTEEGLALGKKCLCKPAKPHSTTALERQRAGRQWDLICSVMLYVGGAFGQWNRQQKALTTGVPGLQRGRLLHLCAGGENCLLHYPPGG